MSVNSTFLNEGLNAYLAESFSSEDAFLKQLQVEAAEAGIPPISIAPEQTAFLQLMLKAINAKVVVEIGSLAGYSAIAMARALPPNGTLHACEISHEHCEFIKRKVSEAGLQNVIQVHEGPALNTLGNLPNEPIDAVFIDADKPNYLNYLTAILPKLRKGGLVIGDNALAWGHVHEKQPDYEPNNVTALRAFNDAIATNKELLSTLVPLGDGMVIGLKL